MQALLVVAYLIPAVEKAGFDIEFMCLCERAWNITFLCGRMQKRVCAYLLCSKQEEGERFVGTLHMLNR